MSHCILSIHNITNGYLALVHLPAISAFGALSNRILTIVGGQKALFAAKAFILVCWFAISISCCAIVLLLQGEWVLA